MPDKRHGTNRDFYRAKTPPKGIADQTAAPEFVDEECTGKYEGDDLFEARLDRASINPAKRIALLEMGQEALAAEQKAQGASLHAMNVKITEIHGDQKAQNVSLVNITKTLDTLSQRDHVTFTSKVEVDTAKKISDVNVQQAQQLDLVAARKARRDFWFKMAGSGAVGAVVLKVLQHFGVL